MLKKILFIPCFSLAHFFFSQKISFQDIPNLDLSSKETFIEKYGLTPNNDNENLYDFEIENYPFTVVMLDNSVDAELMGKEEFFGKYITIVMSCKKKLTPQEKKEFLLKLCSVFDKKVYDIIRNEKKVSCTNLPVNIVSDFKIDFIPKDILKSKEHVLNVSSEKNYFQLIIDPNLINL